MHIVVICWLNLHDDAASTMKERGSDDIAQQLVRTATFLEYLWTQRDLEPPNQWAEVMQRKPELVKLFPALGDRLVARAPCVD